jgi:DNA repair exonuclease SbcCD ATPase subunit
MVFDEIFRNLDADTFRKLIFLIDFSRIGDDSQLFFGLAVV